ncbi:MAG: LEA type 2 family protein [Puia sp.]|nr:LEA type 2 family protein [Puia sp.]
MKQRNWQVWALVVLLGTLVGCRKPEAPEYQGFENIRLSKTSGRETLISADLKFYNPNHFNLELKRAEVDIFLNDKPAGRSSLDSSIRIPKTDTFSIPVTLQLDLQSLLSNAFQILLDKQVNIRMDGRAWLKRSGVPFSVPFHYEGKQPLDSFMQ